MALWALVAALALLPTIPDAGKQGSRGAEERGRQRDQGRERQGELILPRLLLSQTLVLSG